MLDCSSRGRWLETHQRHSVVSLSKTIYPLLSTDSIQEDINTSWHDQRTPGPEALTKHFVTKM